MNRFRITGVLLEETVPSGAWEWPRIRDVLVQRCGEIALGWTLTVQRLRSPGGTAAVILRISPEEPNIEAWGELYTCSEPLAQALSEALATEVVIVACAVGDHSGALARYDGGKRVEAEARVADPLAVAARVMRIDAAALRALVGGADKETLGEPTALEQEPELDGEDFAEQAWLDNKRREAQAWMERYRSLKSRRDTGSENPQV